MKSHGPDSISNHRTSDANPPAKLEVFTQWLLKLPPDAQIVQIGSNDGKQGDPIFEVLKSKPDWKALFVEPVAYLFDRLVANYGTSPNFQFYNAAINQGEVVPFYYVDQRAKNFIEDLPYWYDQLGSFDRNHIIKHLDGILEPFIVEILLNGTSLGELFVKFSIKRIDLLHLDTEGHDWKILSQLDLSIMSPTLILFEHEHLSEKEKIESVRFLADDYHLCKFGMDVLAIHRNAERTLHPEIGTTISKL